MCNEYGVSSIVALRVFRELAEEGLIEKRDGEGYYVRSMESDDSSDTIVCAFRAPQNINLRDNFGNRILCGILAGVAVYGVLVIALGLLRADDVKNIRGGQKLIRLLHLR